VKREVVLRADPLRLDNPFQFVPRMLDRGNVVCLRFLRREFGRSRFGDDAEFVATPDIGVPEPCRVTMMPSARSRANASRTVGREVSKRSANACSVGRRSPSLYSPSSMRLRMSP
jgi:hypothetical protein